MKHCKTLLALLLCAVLMLAPGATALARETTATIWTEGFDSGMSGWTLLDLDGDGHNWVTSDKLGNSQGGLWENEGRGGGLAFTSFSYMRMGNVALTPDNVAVSPAIALPQASSISLSWWLKMFDVNPGSLGDTYAIYVYDGAEELTADNAAQLLTNPVHTEKLMADGMERDVYYNRTVDLTAYAGKTVRIVLRHFNSSNIYIVVLDDFSISATIVEPDEVPPQVFEVKPAEEEQPGGEPAGDEPIDVEEATEELMVR